MIFQVSADLKGSIVLQTLNQAFRANQKLAISETDLYAPDIKKAIKLKLLVPIDNKLPENFDKSTRAIISNKTDTVLILGKLRLNPKGKIFVNKSVIFSEMIEKAEANGYIEIISDEKVKEEITTDEKKEIKEKQISELTENKDEVEAKVWNPKQQELEKAVAVPKTTADTSIIEETDKGEVVFIDEEKEEKNNEDETIQPRKIVIKKKTTKKKITKKNSKNKITRKKKGIIVTKKKINKIEPVGEIKQKASTMEAIIELDSRGHPIKKTSDMLQHLIDEVDSGNEVGFADKEQSIERAKNRGIDIDLDL